MFFRTSIRRLTTMDFPFLASLLIVSFLFTIVAGHDNVDVPGHIIQVRSQMFIPTTLSLTISFSLLRPKERICRYKFAFRPTTDFRAFGAAYDEEFPNDIPFSRRMLNFTKAGFQLNDNYTVEVRSVSCHPGTPQISDVVASTWFLTPSCSAASDFNFSLCVPPPPSNVTFNLNEANPCLETNTTTVFLNWSEPMIPDLNRVKTLGVNWSYQVYWNKVSENSQEFVKVLDRRNIKLPENNITLTEAHCGATYNVDVFAIGPAGRGERVSFSLETPGYFSSPSSSSCDCSEFSKVAPMPSCSCLQPETTSTTALIGRSIPVQNMHFLTNFVGVGMGVLCLCLLVLGTMWWVRERKRKGFARTTDAVSFFNADSEKNGAIGGVLQRFVPELTNTAYRHVENSSENQKGIWIPRGPWAGRIRRECLALKGVIASGSFGSILRGVLQFPGSETSMVVAVKTMLEPESGDNRQALLSEIAVLNQLTPHLNVVGIMGIVNCPSEVLLILEYCGNGDLAKYLRRVGQTTHVDVPARLSGEMRKQFLSFASQITSGMSHLAASNIVHRDLAARNVLLTATYVVKITDFGLSRVTPDYYRQVAPGRVPWKWLAPESLNISRCFSTKSDVWAFGVVLYELFSFGSQPYPDIQHPDDLERFLDDGQRMIIPASCGMNVNNIIGRCWDAVPQARPDFGDLTKAIMDIMTKESFYLSLLDDQSPSYVNFNVQPVYQPCGSDSDSAIGAELANFMY